MFAQFVKLLPRQINHRRYRFNPVIFVIFVNNRLNKPSRTNRIVSLQIDHELRHFPHFFRRFDDPVGSRRTVDGSHYRVNAAAAAKIHNPLIIGRNHGLTALKFGSRFLGIFPNPQQHFLAGNFSQRFAGEAG